MDLQNLIIADARGTLNESIAGMPMKSLQSISKQIDRELKTYSIINRNQSIPYINRYNVIKAALQAEINKRNGY